MTACLPRKFFADIHPKFRTPWKNTILVGLLAAIVGSVTPIDDIGKMVNIGTLLAFVIVSISVMVLRRTNPSQPRPFRTPWVPLIPILGVISQRLHDVQPGLGELGAAVHLAGDWAGRVLQLWAEAQPGAGAGCGSDAGSPGESRLIDVLYGPSAQRGGPFCFKIARWLRVA